MRVINLSDEQREPKQSRTALINLQNLGNNLKKKIKWRQSSSGKPPEQKGPFEEEIKDSGSRSRGRSDYNKLSSSPLITKEKKKPDDQEDDQGME